MPALAPVTSATFPVAFIRAFLVEVCGKPRLCARSKQLEITAGVTWISRAEEISMAWLRKSLLAAAAFSAALASTTVASRTDVHLGLNLNIGPPPPVVEVEPPPRPGYAWAPGYWDWDGHHHVWRKAHWVRARPGYVWEPPHWEERHGRWFFVPGRWVRA
jgi:hypothetical protein